MNPIKIIIMLAAGISISACATSKSLESDKPMAHTNLDAKAATPPEEACTDSKGNSLKPGTAEFDACVLQKHKSSSPKK